MRSKSAQIPDATDVVFAIASDEMVIENDDESVLVPLVSISPSSLSRPEGDSGPTAFGFTVSRTGEDLSGTTTVDYAVTGSGADAADAADFGGALPSGQVSFAAGEGTATITVEVSGDTDVEPDEGFKVTLSDATDATIDAGNASAEGLIRNDDIAAPVFSIAPDDADKLEGTDTSTPFTFTITRSGDLSEESTVTWTVKGSTAEVSDAAKCNDFVGRRVPGGYGYLPGRRGREDDHGRRQRRR